MTLTNIANDFGGGVTVNAGTLKVGAAGVIPTGKEVTVANAGTLDLNGTAYTALKLSGGGTVTNTGGANTTSVLTLDGAVDSTFSGRLNDSDAMKLAVVKNNANNVSLTGTSNFTGGTTIAAGKITANTGTALGSGPVTLAGGTLALGGPPAGMIEGRVAGDFEVNASPTVTEIEQSAVMGYTSAKPPWADHETWVYTGSFYNDTARSISFAANIDDSTLLKIDGNTLISDTTWNNTDVATTAVSQGWHTFEVRFGNGTGGAGPSGQAGWPNTFGFGYDPQGRSSTNVADYKAWDVALAGPDGIRIATGVSPTALYNDVIVTAPLSAIDMTPSPETSVTLGNLTLNGQSLQVTGAVGQNVTFGGPTTVNGASGLKVDLGSVTLAGHLGGSGSLAKTGAGTLKLLAAAGDFSGDTTVSEGTLQVTNITGSATGIGQVNVALGGTLTGNGQAGGQVNVASGGIVVPGLAGTTPGTLSVGGLDLGAGSILNYRFGAAGTSDMIAVAGLLGFPSPTGSITLNVNDLGTPFADGASYNLFSYNSIDSFNPTGSISAVYPAGLPAGWAFNFTTDESGAVKYVKMTVSSVPSTPPGEWAATGGGTWGAGFESNWLNSRMPNGVTHLAKFLSAATGPAIVTLSGAKTVSGVEFQNSNMYTVAGTDALILDNGATAVPVTVALGNHKIETPVTLNSNLSVNVGSALELEISGNITGTDKDIAVTGAGLLVLSGTSNQYGDTTVSGGGTLRVDEAGALPATGTLTITDGTVIVTAGRGRAIELGGLSITLPGGPPAAPPAGSLASVPEPGTLVLFGIGAALIALLRVVRRRK